MRALIRVADWWGHPISHRGMDVTTLDLPGIPKVASGKVREIFDLGDELLMVATDRLSAFDVVFAEPIPGKGAVLNQISAFWFEKLDFVPNHVIETDVRKFPDVLASHRDVLRGRSMIVKKAVPLPVECVVRGYLAGSGWKDYQMTGEVCGHRLPAGLSQADKLADPIFTPATKAQSGHDLNISFEECRRMVGDDVADAIREMSIEIYEHGRAYAATKGILIADTKFEFGLIDGDLVLIDEVLTPDSSRFWPETSYRPGTSPPSFDKQFVRDYLEASGWDKSPPPPALPPEVVAGTASKYIEAFERLTGRKPEA